MKKFGMRNTFDLVFHDGEKMVMYIDTAKEVIINSRRGMNKLIVHDALVDISLIEEIFNGKHYYKNLCVVGKSYVRDLDRYDDKPVLLEISELELVKCIFPTGMEASIVTLEFDFPLLVDEVPNLSFKVKE